MICKEFSLFSSQRHKTFLLIYLLNYETFSLSHFSKILVIISTIVVHSNNTTKINVLLKIYITFHSIIQDRIQKINNTDGINLDVCQEVHWQYTKISFVIIEQIATLTLPVYVLLFI